MKPKETNVSPKVRKGGWKGKQRGPLMWVQKPETELCVSEVAPLHVCLCVHLKCVI